MKHLLLIIICFFHLIQPSNASERDTLPGKMLITVNGQFGFLLAHRPTVRHLQQQHSRAIELEIQFPGNGSKDWQQPFLLPSYSLAYQLINPGSPSMLGTAHALTARMIFPLNAHKKISSTISSGFGVGYVEKPYHRYENFKNVAIGSSVNAVVYFRYNLLWHAGRRSLINTGLSFTHFSNGAFRPPNLGINIPAIHIGYSHYFGQPLERSIYKIDKVKKKPVNKLLLTGGVKGIQSAYGFNLYGVSALALSRHYVLSHKSRLGGGIDLFYDRTLPWKLNSLYHEGLKKSVALRSGIFAGYELTAGRVTMIFQNGAYIFDKYDEDGLIYTKTGVQYAFAKNLIATFHLKSHFAKADYFEYGLGYTF